MSTVTRRIHKIDDATLVQLFKDLERVFPDQTTRIEFELLREIKYDLASISDLDPLEGQHTVDKAHFYVDFGSQRNVTLHFRRGLRPPSGPIEPSARYDEIDLNYNERDPAFLNQIKDQIAKVIGLISSVDFLSPIAKDTDEESTLRELMRGINATHQQMLGSLNDALQANIARRAALEEEAEKREEIRQDEHKAALAELEQQRTELQLQSYRSERRKIMQDLTNAQAIDQRLNLTPKGASRARWAVFFAAIGFGLISFAITYSSISQLGANEALIPLLTGTLPDGTDPDQLSLAVKSALGTTNWYLIIRSVFSSLVGIGAFVYAATWLRTFYEGEVAAARASEKFNNDLVRASWIIETVLEVKQEHHSVVPNHWIEGVTRGLFSDSGPQTATDESVQALKALLGFTASASFGPEGPKVELNRKGAKKLSEE